MICQFASFFRKLFQITLGFLYFPKVNVYELLGQDLLLCRPLLSPSCQHQSPQGCQHFIDMHELSHYLLLQFV